MDKENWGASLSKNIGYVMYKHDLLTEDGTSSRRVEEQGPRLRFTCLLHRLRRNRAFKVW